MNKRISAMVLGALVAGLFALTVQIVFAHNHPVRFDPEPGAVLEEAPSEVTAWFVGPVRRDPNWSYIHVFDAEGNRVDTGEADLSEDRRRMNVGLEADLGPGSYMVTWRNWDDEDGFILGDCYRFYVGQEAAETAITEGQRLFGGQACESIGVSGRDGTPTPEELTPTPAPDPDAPANGDSESGSTGDGDDGVPVWALALGIVGGVVAGGVGMKFIGSRA